MENGKIKELERVLQKMLQIDARAQTDQNHTSPQIATGSIIRRRKGQADKRISAS